jgi:hypothetical protein
MAVTTICLLGWYNNNTDGDDRRATLDLGRTQNAAEPKPSQRASKQQQQRLRSQLTAVAPLL